MTTTPRVAVIGAGAGGLCAAKHLLARGLEVTVLEMGTAVGGLWVYDNDNGRSPAYQSLQINSEAAVTSFEDFPFPDGTPLYPHHTLVKDYLEAYAKHFGVTDVLRFGQHVTSVSPSGDGRWRVRTAAGLDEEFDAVVAAPGHQAEPSHPAYASAFSGTYLHVHDYRVPEPFRGKRVLIVGMGNSALDAAADICTVTASTTLVARSPVLIMPRLLFGVPTARILGRLERRWVPWAVRRRMRIALSVVVHGRMERWGLVTAKTRTHPSSHPTLMTHAAYGRVSFKPDIVGAKGTQVSFVDGTSGEYDVMMAATGYELDLPFLSPDLVPVTGRRVDLYKRIFVPGQPGLALIGYFNVAGGANIRMMDTQAEFLSDVLSGKVRLPDADAIRRDIEQEKRVLRERYPSSPRYGLELDPADYREQLARARAEGSAG